MPNYDVIVYHDLSSLVASVRPGDPARELGDIFGEDMFVSGVYPPLHEGKSEGGVCHSSLNWSPICSCWCSGAQPF